MASQIVYLDFDGEFTAYNGEILTIENVQVNHSLLSRKRIENILSQLNEKYSGQNVVFVTTRPESAEYSTIYIGKTTAFDAYGNFAGIAETVDHGNTNPADNAFVMLDFSANDETFISTISHETDHLLGTLDHGGDGMARYAANYEITSGVISNGITLDSYDYMYISSGGVANSTTVNSRGSMYISSGGTANDTTVNSSGSMSINSGGTANDTTVNYWGHMSINGVANNTSVNHGGFMSISSGGMANSTKVNSGNVSIYFGGVANNTIFNSSGHMLISSGGVANNTTFSSYGYMDIYSNGEANDTTVNSSGFMRIFSGGEANDTTVNSGGSMSIFSDGVANNIMVNSGGRVSISSGGTANEIQLKIGGCLGGFSFSEDKVLSTLSNGQVEVASQIFIIGNQMNILSGCMADYITVNGGDMYISSGGVANSTMVSGGGVTVCSGGVANSTTVNFGGRVSVLSGGYVNNATIAEAGSMYVSAGGSAAGVSGEFFAGSGATVNGILYERDFVVGKVFSSSNFYEGGAHSWLQEDNYLHAQVLSGASVLLDDSKYFENTIIHSGGFMEFRDDSQEWFGMPELGKYERTEFNSLTVKKGGEFVMCSHGLVSNGNIQGILSMDSRSILRKTIIHSGGIAYLSNRTNGDGLTIGSGGNLYIGMSAEGHNITIDGGMVHVATGGILADVTISENGGLYVYGGAVLDGEINVNGTMYLDDDTMNNGNVNFVLSQSDAAPLLNDLSRLTGGSCSVTVETNEAGQYQLAGNADGFTGSIEMRDRNGVSAGKLTTEGFITVDDTLYTLSNSDGILSIEAMIQAYKKSIHWAENGVAESYIVEYSTDNFANVFRVTVNSNTLDNYLPAAGTYQWRVSFDGTTWVNGEQIVANASADQEKVFSDADGDMDIFFANASETWGYGYVAQHLGCLNGWTGTAEQVVLKGKNRISDVFEGSADANLLVLTDDANGDALFVDDIYTSFGNDAARISRIDEIRAGAGDDMIDMTSQQFAYSGDGIKISGGLGDDTIWANCGSNELYGDAGNDRIVGSTDDDIIIGGIGNDIMHGGGGNDTFCFGSDWGNDVIEQLSGGTVTLWFKNGSEANWDANTLTYAGGLNSIRISGVDADQVELKFGYIGDAPAGAFADFSGGKIFEDQTAGILA